LWLIFSKRDIADLEDKICSAVAANVQDPVLQQPLSKLQWLHKRIAISSSSSAGNKTPTLQMLLRLPSLLHPSLPELKERIQLEAEKHLHIWLRERNQTTGNCTVNVEAIATKPVNMNARLVEDHDELLKNLGPGLASVSHFVAVYSCKGGVGKSTVAVNLAYELASQGGRVGLLDLDLYGPSLPTLVRLPNDDAKIIRRSPLGTGMVYPIVHEHVKLLSLGFVNTQVRLYNIRAVHWQCLSFQRCNEAYRNWSCLDFIPERRSRKWSEKWRSGHERTNGSQGCLTAVSFVNGIIACPVIS
jgi:Mrp family chromosome partitioning ATPase